MPTIYPDFSEYSFAFAFVDNLIHGGLLDESSAPRFLSTYAEGKAIGMCIYRLGLSPSSCISRSRK